MLIILEIANVKWRALDMSEVKEVDSALRHDSLASCNILISHN